MLAAEKGTQEKVIKGLHTVTILVRDYDEAISYYCGVLGFDLIEDTKLSSEKRWVRVSPGAHGSQLLLAAASTPPQFRAVGKQGAGRVFLFLESDNFGADYTRLKQAGVAFHEAPRREPYGVVAVFEDLYGNRWDLIEHAGAS